MISKGEKSNSVTKSMNNDADKLTIRGSAWPGLLLVVAGGLMLATNLFQFQIPGEMWPFYVAGFGVLLLLPALQVQAEEPDPLVLRLAAVGAAVFMIGLVSAFAEMVDHYESWAYAWTLVPVAATAGRMFANRGNPDPYLNRRGGRRIQFLLVAFVGLAIFFEFFIFNGYGRWWPILLIAAGAFLLFNPRRS